MLPSEKAAIGVVGEEEERKLRRTGGKEKSCRSDKEGRSEREDKDGPFVFPGGGCKNCDTVVELLVCDCGWFGWEPGKSRADDLMEIS